MRERAQQSCPALSKTAYGAAAAARSRSASAKTRLADLPPSSSVTRLIVVAAPCMTPRPTSVEPVKPIFATSGCSTSRCPTTRPGPTTTLTTPSGIPASRIRSARRSAESGVSSAGFEDDRVPAGERGAELPAGDIEREVPRHDQADDAERLAEGDVDAAGDGDRLAVVLVDGARVEVEDLRDHADLGARAGDRLADVLRFDPRELLGVLLDERGEPAQEGGAIGGSHGTPVLEGLLRPSNRRVGLVDAGGLELGDRLLGGGVGDDQSHRSHLTTTGSLTSRCPTSRCPTPGRGLQRQSRDRPPAPAPEWRRRVRADRPAPGNPTDARDPRPPDGCSSATAPAFDRSRPDRVQHDVANCLEQMLIALDRPPRVVVPKEMPRASMLAVHPASVATVEELHAGGKALLGWTHEQVIVVRHQAIRDDPPALLENDPGKPAQEIEAVEVVTENRLAIVATRGDVVIRPRLEDPRRTCHER